MTTNQDDAPDKHTIPSASGRVRRSEVSQLFAAALDGDGRAAATLHLLGGFDDDAHRASFALLDLGRTPDDVVAPGLLASIDSTLAALRDNERHTG